MDARTQEFLEEVQAGRQVEAGECKGDLGPSTVHPTDSHETSTVPVTRIGCSGESVTR